MNLDFTKGQHPKCVLFAVLNWGLGHATRSIPIIQHLLSHGSEIIIASDGSALELLKQEFPTLQSYELKAYDIRYVTESVEYSLLIQLPGVLKAISSESKSAEELAKKHDPDLIISDSRFGFRSDHVKSIVIAHQLNLISDKIIFRSAGNIGNRRLLNKFDECWVPDFEGSKLSGKLSQKELNIPIIFIGPVSRFIKTEVEEDIDLLVVLSGPEPKRTRFSDALKPLLNQLNIKLVGAEGIVEAKEISQMIDGNQWYNYLKADTLNQYINRSKLILCRAGYTSIMDLVRLDKKAVLIPTRGQSEQEYLGKHLDGQYGFNVVAEEDMEEQLISVIMRLL